MYDESLRRFRFTNFVVGKKQLVRPKKAYYETTNGFQNSAVDVVVKPPGLVVFLFVNFCYKHIEKCRCLPRDNGMQQENFYNMYFTEYQDIMDLKQKFLNMARKPSQIYITCRALDEKHCKDFVDIFKKELKTIIFKIHHLAGTRSNHIGHEQFIANCSNSLFLTAKQKEQLCMQSLQVFLFKERSNENVQTRNIDLVVRNYTCKPVCPPGKTLHFNDAIFSFECHTCTGNLFKSQYGTHQCEPCGRGWLANENKT